MVSTFQDTFDDLRVEQKLFVFHVPPYDLNCTGGTLDGIGCYYLAKLGFVIVGKVDAYSLERMVRLEQT
jgi:hypothetical protein